MSFIAQITADISNFDKNIKKAVDTTNDSTGKMDSKFANLGKSIAKVGVGVAAFGVAAIAAGAGLVKLGIKAGDASAKINNLSTATSLSTDVIQELSYVASASNSSFEGLSRSMDSFQRRLKTVDEEGSKVNEMLSKLGVSTTDTNGELRNMDDLLIDTFSRLGDMDNGLRKNAIGTELFGRSWNEVSLIVSSGSKGIAELRKEANELGLVLDKDTLKSADDFATAMGLVSFQVDKLKTKIGASLVPILENTILPLLQDKVIPAISKVVESIAKGVENMIKAWGDLKAYFTTGAGADTFNAIVRDAIAFKEDITTVFTEIARTLNSIWALMGADLGDETETFLQTINRGFQNTLNLWRNLWIDFKKARASETLIEEFTNIGTMFSNFGKGLVADVVEPVDKVGKAVEDLTDSQIAAMVGLNEFSSEIEETTDSVDGLGDSLDKLGDKPLIPEGSLKELSEKLKILYEQLDNATTTSARVSVATLIKEIEAKKATLELELKVGMTSPIQSDIAKVDTGATVVASDVWNVDNKELSERMSVTAQTVHDNIAEMNEDAYDSMVDFSGLIAGAMTNFAGIIGDAFGGDFSDFGANLLGAVGNFAQQFGGLVIAAAITADSLKKLITNPFLAAAAGAALVTLGAVVSKKAQSMTSNLTGGGYSSAPSMQSTGVSQSMPTGEFRDSYSSGQVEFKISGDNLVGVLNKKKHEETEIYNEKAFEIEYKHKKVEIHIIDFVGDVRNINGTPDLFSLSYNSNINDKGQYILATEAEINIYEDDFFNIDELKTVGETDILIKYFEHDELVWQGFALPDFFQTGITKPRVLRIVATDRLGVLKDIANTSVSNTPKEIIEECLLQTGLTLPVEIRSVDNYLTSTTIERERIEGISAYDVIRSFMVQFNSKIVQYKNKWWVVNKKLLEDGFLGQEIIDIDLVYLDGQREIKPTASDVSLYLEFGGSRKYPENWNFEKWDDATNTFDGWYNHNEYGAPMVQRKGEYYVDSYIKVPDMDYTWDAVFSDRKLNTPSLWSRNRYFEYTYGDRMDRKPQLRSPFAPVRIEGERTEITLKIDYTTMMREGMYLVFSPIIKIANQDGSTKRWWVINNNGMFVSAGKNSQPEWSVFNSSDYIGVAPTYIESDNGLPVQQLFEKTYTIEKDKLELSVGGYAEIQLAWFGYFEPKSTKLHNWIDVFLHSVEFIFNKSEFTGKGLIFKTKQGGDKFSKVRETETTLFSDKINQGVNGYFYNYKYDDTSITNLPKEYLLTMTRQMADMFCSARDFYSLGGKFKVNPLARYKCGNKYFVFVGGVSHREISEIDIEEIVSNDTLIRTDYIYTYFEDSKDNIKSIGTASGSGGSGGTGGGGGMTSSQLEILTNLADWWRLDEENDAIYSLKSVYSLKGVSALGLGPDGGGGGGGGDVEISITGSGNAVTGVSKSGNTLTFAKSSTFALSTHNHTIAQITGLQSVLNAKQNTLIAGTNITISGNTISASGGMSSVSWGEITEKPSTFTPSAHVHTIAQVTDLQSALNGKEPSFTKNTAFNKNFGTAEETVAEGNDSRINNGQTAFEWGNHSTVGYALNSALTAHTGNSTIHITSTERTNWNDANSKKHTHSNKSTLDGITSALVTNWNTAYTNNHTHSNKGIIDALTQGDINVLRKLSLDAQGNVKVDATLWATGGISALGLGDGGGSSGGGVDMLDAWANYTEAKASYYVPASLLVPFRSDTLSRLTSLESGSATSITTTGSGNAVTSISKSGSVITATKGLTFALSAHSHTIAQITGLQGALDLKVSQSDIATAINGIEIGGRNLILNSENRIGFISNNGYVYPIQDKLVSGENYKRFRRTYPEGVTSTAINTYTAELFTPEKSGYYTYSTYFRPNEFDIELRLRFNSYGDYTLCKANEWTQISVTAWIEAGVATRLYGVYGEMLPEAVQWIDYNRVSVTSGNKATDWSPAPEDQVTDWNVTDVNSFAFLKNKPTQLSQFTDNIGVASHIANKANPHSVTTAQIGAVDLTTNQTITGVKTFNANITLGINKYIAGTDNYTGVWNVNNLLWRFGSSKAGSISNIRSEKVGIGTDNPLYKLDVSGTGRFTGNVTAPTFRIGGAWTLELSGTELVFKYNGAIKQRMLSDGTILAVGGITALSTE